MDPNATLMEIIESATSGDANELIEAAQNLADWLNKGGFAPSFGAVLDIAKRRGIIAS